MLFEFKITLAQITFIFQKELNSCYYRNIKNTHMILIKLARVRVVRDKCR